MYSQNDLDDAVASGAITPESAASLRAFVDRQRNSPAVDEEHFRLITGFNDIFVSIAATILLFAVGWIAQSLGQATGMIVSDAGRDGPSFLAPAAIAATALAAVVFLVIAGSSNAVNLTDGLDGLAAGSCAIVLLAYMAITITNGQADLALLAGCFVGASIGFLWFNAFPASIFMGDTGSLGLGGAIGAFAVMTQTELLLIILGGIFVIEALSVLIQVFAFQTFRKRVFLMAPIHHHFELQAWSETKIILRFWIVAAVCSAIGFTLYQQSLN